METKILLENIKKEATNQGITLKKLAKMIGFSDTNLYNIFDMKTRLTVDMLVRISDALKVSPQSWFGAGESNLVLERQVNYENNHDDCVSRSDYEF